MPLHHPPSTLFPYTTLFRSEVGPRDRRRGALRVGGHRDGRRPPRRRRRRQRGADSRSEEHTSELQSLTNIVCRLLLEKKKYKRNWLGRGSIHDVDIYTAIVC